MATKTELEERLEGLEDRLDAAVDTIREQDAEIDRLNAAAAVESKGMLDPLHPQAPGGKIES